MRLFLFALLLALGYAFLRLFLKQLKEGPRRSSAPAPPRRGEDLVQDPVCGKYLPASDAVSVEIRGRRHYFCSATCRDDYQAKA